MGPCFGGGDGSREQYRGGGSRNASARELPAFPEYGTARAGESTSPFGTSCLLCEVFIGWAFRPVKGPTYPLSCMIRGSEKG
jgi:hypothetical protein